MDTFWNEKQLKIEQGKLDLRHWDTEADDILVLDGEWEFFPHQFLNNGKGRELTKENPQFIQVPGQWNHELHPEEPDPFGFASYRLRLYVHPDKDLTYSIRISSIRSSSEIYVNGRLLAKSGQVAETKDEYSAKNLPYSASFTADENGVIEIVVQAANYVDVRSSGIIRSIKFGTEATIMKDIKLSSFMQLSAVIIYLLHSVYALILFILGNREKKLLYFSLLTFCITITSILSNDEKLFHEVFYIGYEWDFRLTNTMLIIGSYALLQCTNHWELQYWRRFIPFYTVVNLGTAGITMFLPPHQIIAIFPVYYLLVAIAMVITVIAIYKKIIKNIQDHPLLLFSLVAFIHHYLWVVAWREMGVSVIHYPFDLIIALGCFASVAFKDYFDMHAETKRLAATLQRINETKDQFLANTSHEFKNPLHGMLNMSQSVLQRERHLLEKKSIKELETVLSVGRRMTLILDDLLDVMSLREGSPRLQKRTILIQPIVTGVIDMLQFSIESKPVEIEMKISEDFPPVHADENRLIQIVFNLLHNAVKYTNEGEITIKAFIKEGRAYIVIADTGIGMDEDMRKRLFLPYEQANDRETMIEGGFGLGLSITKQLVELHGGMLEASSVLGEGSQFTFSLELADDGMKEEKILNRNEMVRASSRKRIENEARSFLTSFEQMSLQTMTRAEKADSKDELLSEMIRNPIFIDGKRECPRILVVDDDPVNLHVLEAILPPDEYEVTTVTSGKEVLTLIDKSEWDLVISDVMMPQMSGYELTRQIRKRFTLTELPILLLTARSQPKDIQSGFLAGANDYVTKPVEPIEIRSRIEALTLTKQMVQEQLRLEAAWLQAQIQPHFIFNTLNAVIALSEIDLEKMQQLLEEFSHLLRHKFEFQNMDELIPIEEELRIVRSYLYIEKVRFDERLHVDWDLDECVELRVPFLSIQPLVENAIRHGIMKRARGGTITIRISVVDTIATIAIEDDGVGIDPVKLQNILERKSNSRVGVGLINTDQRLNRHFGTGLHIQSAEGKGTKISFTVRLEENAKVKSDMKADDLENGEVKMV